MMGTENVLIRLVSYEVCVQDMDTITSEISQMFCE